MSFLAAVLASNGAYAWFNFRDKTSATIWVAFQRYSPRRPNGGDWETKGWWRLEPGQTKTVFGKDLQSVNTYYYYYAESNDGAVWSGPYSTCVPQSAFDWRLNVCCTPTCRTVGFREKYIGGYNNYTINLVK
jgi:uncharacterized membrane protein